MKKMEHKNYYVYFMTNDFNKVLYTGVTSNLGKRIFQHKEGKAEGFTSKYKVKKLVYFEIYHDPKNAILREKQIKRWSRKKKDFLVNKENPKWHDLSENWYVNLNQIHRLRCATLGMTIKDKT